MAKRKKKKLRIPKTIAIRPAGERDQPQRTSLYQRALSIGDPQLGCETGRLYYVSKMTASELAAANTVAGIYGAYERAAGLKRSSRSPSYEVGYRGGEIIEAEGDRKAETDWLDLQAEIPLSPPGLRTWLEQLAVEDRHIGEAELEEVRALLKELAHFFKSGAKKSQPRRTPSAAPAAKLPRSTIERDALRQMLRIVSPNLHTDEIDSGIELFFTLRERERFQQEKAAAKHKL